MNGFLDVVHFVARRIQALCKEEVWMEADELASEEQLLEVEDALGYPLPCSLREFFRTCSSRLSFSWYFEWDVLKRLPKELRDVRNGGILLALEDQFGWKANWSDWDQSLADGATSPDKKSRYHFADLHPFMQAGNGDTLLLVTRGVNEGAVLLEGFETTELQCARLGRSFEEFLELWSKLAFAGPEESVLRTFYDIQSDMLSVDSAEAIRWRQIWAGE